jgi:hypothetical protein
MNKIKDIVLSWATSFNPTQEQKELAEKRLAICSPCEYADTNPIGPFCKICGCAFRAKVFTSSKNGCPKGKW